MKVSGGYSELWDGKILMKISVPCLELPGVSLPAADGECVQGGDRLRVTVQQAAQRGLHQRQHEAAADQ